MGKYDLVFTTYMLPSQKRITCYRHMRVCYSENSRLKHSHNKEELKLTQLLLYGIET